MARRIPTEIGKMEIQSFVLEVYSMGSYIFARVIWYLSKCGKTLTGAFIGERSSW
jgi:hypothetical protein